MRWFFKRSVLASILFGATATATGGGLTANSSTVTGVRIRQFVAPVVGHSLSTAQKGVEILEDAGREGLEKLSETLKEEENESSTSSLDRCCDQVQHVSDLSEIFQRQRELFAEKGREELAGWKDRIGDLDKLGAKVILAHQRRHAEETVRNRSRVEEVWC